MQRLTCRFLSDTIHRRFVVRPIGTQLRKSFATVKASKAKEAKEAKVEKVEAPPPKQNSLQLQLTTAASYGEIEFVKKLLADGANVSGGDYDMRTPLHLAATEGHEAMVKFLVESGADVNAKDRWGKTALEDAIISKRRGVVRLLRQHGALIPSADLGAKFCEAACKGDAVAMELFLEAGATVNEADYDKRTPLHVAAAEGQVKAVELLIASKANVNALDRFGNTPLEDAQRGAGRQFRSVVQLLREAGASSAEGVRMASGVDLRTSLHEGLPMICERWDFHYAEIWLPSKDGEEFVAAEWHADKQNTENFRAFFEDHRPNQFAATGGIMTKCFRERKAFLADVINEETVGARKEAAEKAGVKAIAVVPIFDANKVAAVVKLFARDSKVMTEEQLLHLTRFSGHIVRAGLNNPSQPVQFDPIAGVNEGQLEAVFRLLVQEGVFSPSLLYHELDWFYNMGLKSTHLRKAEHRVIAANIHSYIAAKKFATTTGSPEDIWLHIENNEKMLGPGGPEQALFIVPNEHRKLLAVERNLLKRIALIPKNRPFSLEYFLSTRSCVPRGKKRLAIYVLQTHNYANPSVIGEQEPSIWECASDSFLASVDKEKRDWYQEVIRMALDRLSPVHRICKPSPDGSIPVMFAFRRTTHSASAERLLHLTELLHQYGLQANRKFIETFANNLIVFTVYIEPAPVAQIEKLITGFGMLNLVPTSPLTPLFLKGEYDAEEYTYLSAVSRFVYYFIHQRSEEMESLSATFKNDTLNMGRLRNLANALRREAVSMRRVYECLEKYPDKVEKLFQDFKTRVTGNQKELKQQLLQQEEKLRKEWKEVPSTMDQQILSAILTFNTHVRKTNMYKLRKSAIAFRMDPAFLKAGDEWPSTPYAIIFAVSSDFQAFHIRFHVVARGGIRILNSRDIAEYERNQSTLFSECYGLAYTQNKKNKDLPEFGSKGVILPNLETTHDPIVVFQKYCAAIMDLLIPNPEVVDNFGSPELLFFGPDERTAGFMEWACEYAKKRGYPYARSFTTGKPPSHGGIPHDLFGMTTRSVHRYVVNSLDKLGLKEEKVTKVQTGGPDGDLGSNEILLSKDITKAVVDGSGVLYDPEGLDRKELERLAKGRKMIEHFNIECLSKGGFRVGIREAAVTLPHGELVENGLSFRNGFHLHPLFNADLFVPCGGRPESINLRNVHLLFNEQKVPRFKIIIEGANLFLTQDARMVLEDAGVVVYKDASTNKGGVTSSSLEVLSALAMTPEEHQKHMCVTPKNKPAFYDEYVAEIIKRIETNADLEFNLIWNEHERTKKHRYILTDLVSDKINALRLMIHASHLYQNEKLRHTILRVAIPESLQKLVGMDNVMKRVPPEYLKSIFSTYIASRYVYKLGIDASEFSFFEFMQSLLRSEDVPKELI